MLMQRLLTRLGCKVSTAENGEMALEMILRSNTTENSATQPISEQSNLPKGDGDTKFHVIFLDNQMPILSGLKTVEKLREIGRGDFVVGVTGNALLDDQQEYLAAGVDQYVIHPLRIL